MIPAEELAEIRSIRQEVKAAEKRPEGRPGSREGLEEDTRREGRGADGLDRRRGADAGLPEG